MSGFEEPAEMAQEAFHRPIRGGVPSAGHDAGRWQQDDDAPGCPPRRGGGRARYAPGNGCARGLYYSHNLIPQSDWERGARRGHDHSSGLEPMNWRHPTPLLVGVALVVAVVAALAAILVVVRPGRQPDVARPPDVAQQPTAPRTVAPTAPPTRAALPAQPATSPPTSVPTPPPVARTAQPAPPATPPAAQPTSVPPAAPTPTVPSSGQARPAVKPTPVPIGLTEQDSRVFRGQEYYLYVPKGYDGNTRYRLLVMIHGYGRNAEDYTEQFTDFADRQRYVVLAPYFPEGERFQQLGIGEDEETIRFDERTLGLVAEIGGRLNVETERFDLFGFSAGGQFANRFLYAHPDRIRSVVVAAPGTVTVPTDRYRWPMGLRNLDTLAKVHVNLDRVRQVRVMLIVGEDDEDDENLRETDEANRFGETRLERARSLHEAWEDAKIGHQYVEVKDLDHTLDKRIVERATRFLAET